MAFSAIMDSNSYTGAGDLDPATDAMVEKRRATLGPSYRLFYNRPVHLVKGSGAHLFDAEGNKYLDAYNNVASVGHCNPRVIEAVTNQMSELNTHTRYLHGGILDYSEQLLATFPAEISSIMFTCTGSEANDLAVRVAEEYTGGTGVIVTEEAYHGNSALISAMSPSLGVGVALGANVRTVPAPDSYRIDPAVLGRWFADQVSAAIADLERHGHKFSALLLDSIFSSDGIYVDPTVLAPAVEVVHRAGGVFIADEVQPGFSRTGEAMWGFQRHGVVPDLVTMGKPMGNGIPVAAMAARPEILDAFARETPYFNTFGGNPVSMAAAQAVLDVIQGDGLAEHARTVGNQMRSDLRALAKEFPFVGDVRGTGLYTGVEIVTDPATKEHDGAQAQRIVDTMRDNRVLISVCGGHGNILKVRPPLVFSMSDLDWFMTAFSAVVKELA
ncbi:aspartate aminotransferase family protein [Mycobacterium sp. CBMA 234]|uniref:aspartate aminotransferase family protein n=1 Tax=Mycolicibacterium sp. CBMA 234 TaxID=1918495 RepID=UPI0012DC3CD6|nr:aspartate aminotransferase family protein [Mycolicibacterium sp. CBMA 234]MUL66128.1 aspartate aminotransferase family protein [Mycolicibacterium sp. CBMA 234]